MTRTAPRPLRRIDAGGVSALLRDGRGTPLVLLHGIGSNAESFRPLLETLATGRPLVAWDMPGYGASQALPQSWPVAADYAGALLDMLDRLGWLHVDLLGHSLGCVVAAAAAKAAPERIGSLTLIAPALGYLTPVGTALPKPVADRIADLERLGPASFAAARAVRLVHRADARPAVLRAVTEAMARVNEAGYRQASHMLASADVVAAAAVITCPVHVICGSEDVITPPQNARRLFEALQATSPQLGHELTLVNDAGHAICVEKPADIAALVETAHAPEPLPDDDAGPARVEGYSVPPVTRAVKLLRHIAARKSVANLSQAARAIGINRTTLLRLIHTLEAEAFIERIPGTDDYTLGTGLIELAAQKIFSMDAVEAATPVLARLSAETGLSSHLGILQDREVIYVLRQAPNVHLVSNVRVGSRLPAHATTMGRILLAHMPWTEVETLYRDVDLGAVTAKTATTMEQLRRQVEADRLAGVAASQSNYEPGIDSFAAPVFDYSGKAIAAINVSGPESTFREPASRREGIAAAVRRAGAEISKRMGYIGERAAVAAGLSGQGGAR